MDRNEIETALAAGNLWAAMINGRFWKLRRNGATQTWKRDPSRFSIPVKAGLKACGRITEDSVVVAGIGDIAKAEFVICERDPNK